MSFEIRDGYIVCTSSGEVHNVESAIQRSEALMHKSFDTRLTRFLMDDSRLKLTLEAHDITQVAHWLDENHAQTLGGRLAVLYNPEYKATFKLCETIYQNRSLSYRIFQDEKEAVAWLMR